MNLLTKAALASALVLSVGFSVVPAYAKPKITFAKCLETRSHFICRFKSILGSVEKEKKKAKTASSGRLDEFNKRGLLDGLVREVSQSKYNTDKITCGDSKLLAMIEAKTSPKRIASSCFKKSAKAKK